MARGEARNWVGFVLRVVLAAVFVSVIFSVMFRFSIWLDKKVPDPYSREAEIKVMQLRQEAGERFKKTE